FTDCFVMLCASCFSNVILLFFFSSRRRHTRSKRDWSSDVCSSDLKPARLDDFHLLAGLTFFVVLFVQLPCFSLLVSSYLVRLVYLLHQIIKFYELFVRFLWLQELDFFQ